MRNRIGYVGVSNPGYNQRWNKDGGRIGVSVGAPDVRSEEES
jgi:hypothetical protein